LGNVDPQTAYKELLDKIKGGMIETVRMIPEKKCAFVQFIDPAGALNFYLMNQNSQLKVNNRLLKIGWGKSSPLRSDVAHAVSKGASRNIYIGHVGDDLTEESIVEDFKRYGDLDKIDFLPKKQIAFVHFVSIGDAMKALEVLSKDEKYSHRKLNFGRDRSSYDRTGDSFTPPQSIYPPPMNYAPPPSSSHTSYSHPYQSSPQAFYHQPPMAMYAPPPPPPLSPPPSSSQQENNNRTVYIGNLHPDTTCSELLDNIRGGNVASCKMVTEKNCAFITFVEPENASIFHRFAMSNRDGMIIHGQEVKIGWGKPNPLPPNVIMAVSRGATRNVYLGGIDLETITEKKLESELSQYGTIDKINIVSDKNIAFVNFTSIQNAVKAVAALRQDPAYSKYKINYGKDRCARI